MDKKQLHNVPVAEKVKNFGTTASQVVKTKKFWVELLIMTLGMFVAALGIYFFLIPSKLIVGSITGLSLVISQLLPFVTTGTVIFRDQLHPAHSLFLAYR